MSLLLALGASISYGVSDFVAGITSKNGAAFAVAIWASVGGLCGMLLLAVLFPGQPTAADLAWGFAGGLGNGIGGAFLYRGLANGRMGVVSPISALTSALLPLAVGLLLGERPNPLSWSGIILALPAIWMISRERGSAGKTAPDSAMGLTDGILAGVGFGGLFVATGQIHGEAGFLPLVINQLASIPAIILLGVLLNQQWRPTGRTEAMGFVSGLLAATAILGFMLAAQRGMLSISSVLTSLYPAATIALASMVLKERIHPSQAVGLLLACGAVVMIALG